MVKFQPAYEGQKSATATRAVRAIGAGNRSGYSGRTACEFAGNEREGSKIYFLEDIRAPSQEVSKSFVPQRVGSDFLGVVEILRTVRS